VQYGRGVAKTVPPPPELQALRREIDQLDRQLLQLLRQRMDVVRQVATVKQSTSRAIRDFAREREILDDRRARAEALDMNPAPIESIYRQIMLASRDYQAALGASAPRQVDQKRVAIIGGHGEMGGLLARLFAELGHRVTLSDLDTELTPKVAAAAAEVVVISVPIETTLQVIAEVGPALSPEALLMDITSIKQAPLAAMLAATEASVIGTHPMFGPGVHSLQGQRVVVCAGRGKRWHRWLVDLLEGRGLVVTEADAAEHDRAMALVQVLTHFQTQVLGRTLEQLNRPIEASRPFTSPAYLMELYVAARHFAQDPRLYGPIEMLNPETAAVTAAFSRAAEELREILERRDQGRFDAIFEEVRAYFGDFTAEALEQSSFLIDRLVERGLG